MLIAAVNLFADDTLIYVNCEDINEGSRLINSELSILSKWLKVNRLKLNSDNTKCMVMNSSENEKADVKIDGIRIENVNSMKYLGIIVDKKLKFKENIDYMC